MGRVLRFLVITLTLTGQPLPHAHAGSRGPLECDEHLRPHFHLGGSHTHDERAAPHDGTSRRQETPAWSAQGPDHDCDAIFVGEFRASRALQKVFMPFSLIVALPLEVPAFTAGLTARYELQIGPANSWSGTPLFLRTTSLRI